MFSATATESSSSMPRTMMKANSDIRLMVNPSGTATSMAAAKEMGTPQAATTARRQLRKMKRAARMSTPPWTMLLVMTFKRRSMKKETSSETARSMPFSAARARFSWRMRLISRASVMASPCLCLETLSSMAGLPRARTMTRCSANPSETLATSRTRRAARWSLARRTTEPTSSAV